LLKIKIVYLPLCLEYGENFSDTAKYFTGESKLFFHHDENFPVTYLGEVGNEYGGAVRKLHPCFKERGGKQVTKRIKINRDVFAVQSKPCLYKGRVYAKCTLLKE
jgi:hypothetical protein